MSLKKKKIIFTIVSALILTIPLGCSKENNAPNQAPTATSNVESPNATPTAINTIEQDQELTKKLTSEKIVQSGKVYLTGDKAVASITFKEGTDEKAIKELSTKYANTLKQKYTNKKIDAYGILKNQVVLNISL
ncbi:hypothetical protein EHS13_13920 [Paenibacillus psychroresistens]|uniref:Lipoprotein n=1 Tax=Paenibacillus psychroresistens TaxID=1778678 RepID=A0A6B8RJI3_9BACL|nr:hypothetical protein [Paenibacillus psychroresistens]QGQ95894.1 hypothetical protein EHS13_13920 [Paenibacillus psychroresistens]